MCLTPFVVLATSYGSMVLAILAAALGLGFIIFVHELGHFAVAKACGVKCHKFMIGFDVGGYKIGKQIGETYYGIGILPLGGYVQMMGQNDDPRMNEEQIKESEASVGEEGVATKEIVGPDGKKHLVDARSYIAKSVPQRMAIISAGVIMNVIFAFIFAFIAFSSGVRVPTQPAIVSNTDPGTPAWEAGLRADDKITRIDDIQNPWFNQLLEKVTLSGKGDTIEFDVLRTATGEEETLVLKPSRERRKIAQVGVSPAVSLKLSSDDPTTKFSPSSEFKDEIPAGGTVTSAGGQEVKTYGQLQAVLATNASKPLSLTIQPPVPKAKKGEEPVAAEPVTVTVPANQAEYVGLVMKMGPITSIQKDSPADKAGIKEGDVITAINGKPIGMIDETTVGWDPRTLGSDLSSMGQSGETVEISVERGKGEKTTTETFNVPLRAVDWFERTLTSKSPASAPALGIAFYLTNKVVGVLPGSPADNQGIEAGDTITSVKMLIAEEHVKEFRNPLKEKLDFEEEKLAWAWVTQTYQDTPPGTKVELKIAREGREEDKTVELDVVTDPNHYSPLRGIALTMIYEDRYAESVGEQASMAWGETRHALMSVYRFLYRIINRDIDPRLLGGPITIARASYLQALEGPGTLLLFLTLISANLAVVNFLPIPVLDGGHMVFLAYEGIFGRPPNEYLANVLNLLGLAFILCLMLFVFGLDFGIIDRGI